MIANTLDRNAQLAAIAALYAGDKLEIWSGTVPSVDAVPSGTKLVEMTLPNPCFSAPGNGQMAKTGTWRTNAALLTGTPTFYRMVSAGGEVRQGSAAMNSGAEVIVTDPDDANATQILANRAVEVSTFTIIQP